MHPRARKSQIGFDPIDSRGGLHGPGNSNSAPDHAADDEAASWAAVRWRPAGEDGNGSEDGDGDGLAGGADVAKHFDRRRVPLFRQLLRRTAQRLQRQSQCERGVGTGASTDSDAQPPSATEPAKRSDAAPPPQPPPPTHTAAAVTAAAAETAETAVVVLTPGDALYIPPGWLHHVEALRSASDSDGPQAMADANGPQRKPRAGTGGGVLSLAVFSESAANMLATALFQLPLPLQPHWPPPLMRAAFHLLVSQIAAKAMAFDEGAGSAARNRGSGGSGAGDGGGGGGGGGGCVAGAGQEAEELCVGRRLVARLLHSRYCPLLLPRAATGDGPMVPQLAGSLLMPTRAAATVADARAAESAAVGNATREALLRADAWGGNAGCWHTARWQDGAAEVAAALRMRSERFAQILAAVKASTGTGSGVAGRSDHTAGGAAVQNRALAAAEELLGDFTENWAAQLVDERAACAWLAAPGQRARAQLSVPCSFRLRCVSRLSANTADPRIVVCALRGRPPCRPACLLSSRGVSCWLLRTPIRHTAHPQPGRAPRVTPHPPLPLIDAQLSTLRSAGPRGHHGRASCRLLGRASR